MLRMHAYLRACTSRYTAQHTVTIANANIFAPADARYHLVNHCELTLSFEADSLSRGNVVYRFFGLL